MIWHLTVTRSLKRRRPVGRRHIWTQARPVLRRRPLARAATPIISALLTPMGEIGFNLQWQHGAAQTTDVIISSFLIGIIVAILSSMAQRRRSS